jgi:hypothetical protein
MHQAFKRQFLTVGIYLIGFAILLPLTIVVAFNGLPAFFVVFVIWMFAGPIISMKIAGKLAPGDNLTLSPKGE